MSNDTQNTDEGYVSVSLEYGPGQTLADSREAKGLTIADVATRLNVTEAIVNGLERDDYTNLPPTIYTRGYLRNYANLLEIDPEPLLERHKQLTSAVDEEQVTKPAAIHAETSGRMIRKKQFKRKKDRSTSLFIVLLILMMGGIGYGIYAFMTKSSSNYPSSSVVEQQAKEDLNESNIPPQQVPDDTSEQDNEQITIPQDANSDKDSVQLAIPDNASANDQKVEIIDEDEKSQTLALSLPANSASIENKLANQPTEIEQIVPIKDSDSISETSTVKEEVAQLDLNAEGNQSSKIDQQQDSKQISDEGDIKLVVADDSYIEITDSSGKRFFFRVLAAGTIKEISGVRPFKVVLGNAGAVKLEYNGQPYDFGNYGLGKVARFSLQ